MDIDMEKNHPLMPKLKEWLNSFNAGEFNWDNRYYGFLPNVGVSGRTYPRDTPVVKIDQLVIEHPDIFFTKNEVEKMMEQNKELNKIGLEIYEGAMNALGKQQHQVGIAVTPDPLKAGMESYTNKLLLRTIKDVASNFDESEFNRLQIILTMLKDVK